MGGGFFFLNLEVPPEHQSGGQCVTSVLGFTMTQGRALMRQEGHCRTKPTFSEPMLGHFQLYR